MIKKYKLIKCYPKSPKLGTIMEFGKGRGDTEQWIKDYPNEAKEFWEEVVTFTSEDGVEILFGRSVYWVINYESAGWDYAYRLTFEKAHLSLDFVNTYKIFSTKQAALNYVSNSKVYTKQQMLDFATDCIQWYTHGVSKAFDNWLLKNK